MKLLIPPAKKVFESVQTVKEPSIETVVLAWLNTNVYKKITSCEPKVSTARPPKITGSVCLEVPFEYFRNQKDFVRITKAHLVPLGYDVDFTHDGVGITELCVINWEA